MGPRRRLREKAEGARWALGLATLAGGALLMLWLGGWEGLFLLGALVGLPVLLEATRPRGRGKDDPGRGGGEG